ncbi:MAG: universal stress protein, partial [Cyclobacteriaceae bacterium]|nr:universal stress protein [Cyclobacteriaceae bacterium]
DPMGVNLHAYFQADLIQQVEENIREKLRGFTLSVPVELMGVREFEWGNPFAGISRYITEKDPQMVIMGSKGATGLKGVFIGSVTEKIVRTARCPVIAVKGETHITDIKDIVFGNDLKEGQEDLMERVKQLQHIFNATLHIVRVNTPDKFKPDRESLPLLRDFIAYYNIKNATLNVYSDSYEDQGLIYFAEEIGADMIALGTHGKRGLGHFISGSIAEDVVNHAKRPIWTYIIH